MFNYDKTTTSTWISLPIFYIRYASLTSASICCLKLCRFLNYALAKASNLGCRREKAVMHFKNYSIIDDDEFSVFEPTKSDDGWNFCREKV